MSRVLARALDSFPGMETIPPPTALEGRSEALAILKSLVAGRHPLTGAPLPEDSCYQSARILRALLASLAALERKVRSGSGSRPCNAGKPWSQEEDQALVTEFEAGASLAVLAQDHQRTRGGIESRLMRLGKLERK